MSRPALTRYTLAEVVLDETTGARAILRPARGGRATLSIPLGAVDATVLSLLLHGLSTGERPSWHALYGATLAIGGVEVERLELDVLDVLDVSGSGTTARLAAAVVLSREGARTRVAAPVEAALMIALEARAPLFVTAQARAAAEPAVHAGPDRKPDRGDTPDTTPGGQALLATLLASLPDEDFGEMH